MNPKALPGILLLSLMFFATSAQVPVFDFGFERDADAPVLENGQPLAYPWAGGINSVRFSEIDLDLDGTPDLLASMALDAYYVHNVLKPIYW